MITTLAGGVGGARFADGLVQAAGADNVTVVVNTADDFELYGLRICPDLDTLMYTLGGGIDDERGWGRLDESWRAKEELAAYGSPTAWFGLGDRDLATHLRRTQLMLGGMTLSEATASLCERWQPGVTLLPMSDGQAETHVTVTVDGVRRAIHFQEWWIKHRAAVPAESITLVHHGELLPAPGVLEAIEAADVVLLPPSNPVVSIGTVLQVKGVREALEAQRVVGLSPIIGGAPVRGMADACLEAIGVETSAEAVGRHYGADLLDGWLVDTADAGTTVPGVEVRAVPLLMTDLEATAAMARAALELAGA
jgi:LPPG:FO 2-phospho-L-lactate transferase